MELLNRDKSEWVHIPIVRMDDKTLVYFIENRDGIPCHVTMELNKDKEVVKKHAIPLSKIWA